MAPALALMWLHAAVASTVPPPAAQAALFKKLLVYDQTLAKQPGTTTIVIALGPQATPPETLRSAFAAVGFQVAFADPTNLAAAVQGRKAVVYLFEVAAAKAVRDVCASHGVLSITALPDVVKRGDASLGVSLGQDGKPQIMLNIERAAAERHAFSPVLGRVAQVVGR